MPLVSSLDAWRHPNESWERIGRRRLFWETVPASMTLASVLAWSLAPSALALAVAAFYAAKVRPLLSVADGVSRPRLAEASKLTPREQGEVGEMMLAAGGVVLFAAFVGFVANDGRELLIGFAIAASAGAAIVTRIIFIVRRANSR